MQRNDMRAMRENNVDRGRLRIRVQSEADRKSVV